MHIRAGKAGRRPGLAATWPPHVIEAAERAAAASETSRGRLKPEFMRLLRHLLNIGLREVLDLDPVCGQLDQRRKVGNVMSCPATKIMRFIVSEPKAAPSYCLNS